MEQSFLQPVTSLLGPGNVYEWSATAATSFALIAAAGERWYGAGCDPLARAGVRIRPCLGRKACSLFSP